ncbi:germination protein [Kroppenstedtia guangzhouensis]|uniref:Germination protein n=1 Tax=Kroppenstedtia guangzhouensis TaxID=1274356 RepID=A0ABQ1FYI9_9BACL|nr:endospore germination permease [Kroppenstedtia guangzhouensis]GGA33117.1 germination protein [Kroppenstedtia guangzhouensis]
MNRNQQQLNQSISLYQGYALVMSTLIGVGVLQFQRGIVQEAGPNGVWTILIGGLTPLAEVWLVTLLMKRFPGKNIVQLTRDLLGTDKNPRLGTWLSLPFLGALSFFWLVATAIVARTFGEVLIGAILPMTPMEVIIGTLIFSATFVVVQQVHIVARFCEFLLPVLFFPITILLLTLVQGVELENFLPLFELNWKQVLNSVLSSSFVFAGISVLYIFMGYYQQPKQAMKPHLLAVLTVIFGYWVTLATSIGVFGPQELTVMMWPTLDLVKQAEVPGQLLSRLESPILSIWVVAVFTTLVTIFASFVDLGVTLFNLKERHRKWLAWGAAPVIYGLAFWPSDVEELLKWGDRGGWFGFVVSFSVALILLGIAWVRGRKGRKSDASSSA